jgi:cell division protein ZapB
MISEFQDLSDKIDRLAQLTQSLRSENYLLRQANALLSAENVDFKQRLIEAQRRVEALLAQLEPESGDGADGAMPDNPDTDLDINEASR